MTDIAAVLTLVLAAAFCASVAIEWRERRRGVFPFIIFVAAYYLAFHGILSWYAEHYVPHLPYTGTVSLTAGIFIAAFLIVQIAGYALSSMLVPVRVAPDRQDPVGPLSLVAWGAIALSFLFFAFPVLNSLPSLPQLRQPIWYFGLGSMSYLLLTRRLSRMHAVAFVAAVALKVVLDARNGEVTPIVFSGVIFVSVAFFLRRDLLAAACLAACILTVGSYGYVKYFARVIVSESPANIFRFTPEFSLDSVTASINAMARRSSHALLTSHVLDRTPASVPYADGRNPFLDALTNHIPRVIWPDKPREARGNEFGKKYGILKYDDDRTSWNLAWTVDFFSSGGIALSLVNVFLLGVALGLAVRLLSMYPDKAFGFGLFSATVFPLFYQESNFSLMAGSILWNAVILLAVYGLTRRLLRSGGERPLGTSPA